ncbi:MAG: hypothetical protein ACHQ03_08455 [Candidatus Bathyarchaeia archaeon]
MDWNSFEPSNNGQIIYQTVNPTSNVQPQAMDYFWTVNVNSVLLLQSHQKMTISKFGSTNPSKAGFVRTYIEESENQISDYRRTLPDGRGIHVREFSDCYVIHWDKVCPLVNPIEHINQDTQYGPALSALAVGGIAFAAIAFLGSLD